MHPWPSSPSRRAARETARRARSLEEAAVFAHHAPQERTRAIPVFAILLLQTLEPAKHALQPDLVRPGEQPLRIIYPSRHREIDVLRRRDAHMDRVDRFVDQH